MAEKSLSDTQSFALRSIFAIFVIALSCNAPSKALANNGRLPSCAEIAPSTSIGQGFSEQRYHELRRGCTFNWVEDGVLRAITWRLYENDFAPPSLSFSPPSGYTLTSQRPPSLIDVNYDGSSDLVTFNEIGGTNGDFDIFLYDLGRNNYSHMGTLHGNWVARDEAGDNSYLVAQSKNGPHAYFQFYEFLDQKIQPVFDVDPQDTCRVLDRGPFAERSDPNGTFYDRQRQEADLIAFYCDIYNKAEADERRTPLGTFPDINYVPEDTIFYCQIGTGDNLKAVTITHNRRAFRYAFGPLYGEPEIVLDRIPEEVQVKFTPRSEYDVRLDEIGLRNGTYTYTVYSSRDTVEGVDKVMSRSLVVRQDGVERPIFSKNCNQNASFDMLPSFGVN